MGLATVSPAVLRDQQLLALMAGGDDGAFREFYRRHAGCAFGLAFRVLRDRGLAEDAVQEAFLAAWRQADSYRASLAKPSFWLLTFVHRRAVDQVRRQQRHTSDSLELQTDEVPAAEDEAMTGMPTRAWIQEGLARLTPPAREVLELAYFAGLTQVEIAERLDAPLGTIKSRTFNALQALDNALAA
jgi:RNA polymerase sigma-70 factor (ECF subfamily)